MVTVSSTFSVSGYNSAVANKNMTSHLQTIDCSKCSYEDWIKAVFAHPVPSKLRNMGIDFVEPDKETTANFLGRLFADPLVLEDYLDEQVGDGLWFLVDNACSNHMFALYDDSQPLDSKLSALKAIPVLFEKYLASHCSEALSHLSESDSSLNLVCYMWWDIAPIYGHPDDAILRILDEAILDSLERILRLDSLACRESALHGLGHWHSQYPERVESIVDNFLQSPDSVRAELRKYAEAARCGCVN